MFFKPSQAVLLMQCENYRSNFGMPAACSDVNRLKASDRRRQLFAERRQARHFYNGTTQEEIVDYYFTTTSPYVATAMRVINDAVRFPRFDETDFENEKRVVIGELERNESNPFGYLNRAMNDKLFYKYPTERTRPVHAKRLRRPRPLRCNSSNRGTTSRTIQPWS